MPSFWSSVPNRPWNSRRSKRMPCASGISNAALTISLVAIAASGAIPAIAVTAYASVKERQEALDAGFQWHVGKPVDPEQLIAAVVEYDDLNESHAALSARGPERPFRGNESDITVARIDQDRVEAQAAAAREPGRPRRMLR